MFIFRRSFLAPAAGLLTAAALVILALVMDGRGAAGQPTPDARDSRTLLAAEAPPESR